MRSVHLIITPLFRSLLWPSGDFPSINWHHFAWDESVWELVAYFSSSPLPVAPEFVSGINFDEVKAKHNLRALDWVWFFSFTNLCQFSKGLSCDWLKRNKNTYKRSNSEKSFLISGKNSFCWVFRNCTFKTLPRGREECFENKMLK